MSSQGKEWEAHAACVGVDAEVFFPSGISEDFNVDAHTEDPYAEARGYCSRCLVRPECLADELSRGVANQHGCWGGLDPLQRRRMLRRRAKRASAGLPRLELADTG